MSNLVEHPEIATTESPVPSPAPPPVVGPAGNAPGGLSTAEAAERLERFGPNAVVEAPPRTWFILLHRFWGVIPWMLEAAVVIDLVLGRYAEAGVIAALLVFSAGLGFYQERRGKKAVALLRSQLSVSARARRDGAWQTIPAAQLVPDDVVYLRAGDVVPADVALADGVVSLDQSQLTGESLPVEARAGDSAYAGSQVARGEATGVVTATAGRTKFGKTAQLVRLARAPKRLQLLTVSIAKYLLALDAVLIAIVIAAAVWKGTSLSNTLPFALMLLVASVPVTLPAMFTMSAAMGAANLSRHGVLATRLSAIEDAATMDAICVDKTGTITENRLSVESVAPLGDMRPDEVLALAVAASDEATQDPLDLAILAEARRRGLAIGVASATDVAKASASLVLTKEGLGEILLAIKGSRNIYQRMQATRTTWCPPPNPTAGWCARSSPPASASPPCCSWPAGRSSGWRATASGSASPRPRPPPTCGSSSPAARPPSTSPGPAGCSGQSRTPASGSSGQASSTSRWRW